jgi:hypothetical protein
MDEKSEEGKRCLIDNFINAIYLYDDKLTIAFNYREGMKTVLLSECDFSRKRSYIQCCGQPRKKTYLVVCLFSLFFG